MLPEDYRRYSLPSFDSFDGILYRRSVILKSVACDLQTSVLEATADSHPTLLRAWQILDRWHQQDDRFQTQPYSEL
jgi:hypothetical protein